jgi:D-glycero-beta-D-manno-heptose-7-phosphate kinase
MSLFQQDDVMHEPTRAREVFDVSGAGDTVIATLGVMLAAGLDFRDAVHIANRAAGVVVGKLGTAVVSYQELVDANL